MAFIDEKPAKERGIIAASEPAANMISASPRRMVLRASPIACEPTAHADVTPKLGPWEPSSIPMTLEAVLPRSAGIVKGDTFGGPDLASLRVCSSKVAMPPNAEPT